jgi:transposase-like protein
MMSREERVSNWRALVERQTESGKSAAAFCRERHINRQRFYAWRRRFRCDPPGAGFIRLVPTSKISQSGIRIVLDHQTWIEVERGFDALALKEAILALRAMVG